jgi:hypothetical protein
MHRECDREADGAGERGRLVELRTGLDETLAGLVKMVARLGVVRPR